VRLKKAGKAVVKPTAMIKAKPQNGVSNSTIIANAKPPMAVAHTLIWPIRERRLRAWAILSRRRCGSRSGRSADPG
jgi:hypothetical protein